MMSSVSDLIGAPPPFPAAETKLSVLPFFKDGNAHLVMNQRRLDRVTEVIPLSITWAYERCQFTHRLYRGCASCSFVSALLVNCFAACLSSSYLVSICLLLSMEKPSSFVKKKFMACTCRRWCAWFKCVVR